MFSIDILKFSQETINRTQDEALGNNYKFCGVYSPEPRAEVYIVYIEIIGLFCRLSATLQIKMLGQCALLFLSASVWERGYYLFNVVVPSPPLPTQGTPLDVGRIRTEEIPWVVWVFYKDRSELFKLTETDYSTFVP